MIEEKPVCKVTVVSIHGVRSRNQMDEKSAQTGLYANGIVLWGYDVAESGEHIWHVRVSPIGYTKTQWIRMYEQDGSNPLVKVEFLVDPQSELAVSLAQIAVTNQELTKEIKSLRAAIEAETSHKVNHG